MYPNKTIRILVSERGILYKNKEFQRILASGTYKFFDPLNRYHCEIHDITYPEFPNLNADILIKEYASDFNGHIQSVNLNESQLGLFYLDGKLIEVLQPASKRYFWKGPLGIRIDVYNIEEEFNIPNKLVPYLQDAKSKRSVSGLDESTLFVQVKENHEALLIVDGAIHLKLSKGLYGFWKFNRDIVAYVVDTRLQNLELTSQEVLTQDKVSIRINLSSNFKITDVQKVFETLPSHKETMHKELQFALREAVGTRSLDALLGDKSGATQQIFERVANKIGEFGIELSDVDIKDIILPGEMRVLMNRVVEAEKAAQANLIKRREETAATRSLHNTAKMLDNNPTLMRLKELEVLEKVTENIDEISVHNGLNGIMNDLIKLRSSD